MFDFQSTIIALLRLFILIYLGLGITLVIFEKRIIYLPNFPEPSTFDDCQEFPGSEKIDFKSVRFHYYKHELIATPHRNVAVFYHGNAGSACDRSLFAPVLKQSGFSYIFVEYPGYAGDTQNKPSKNRILKNVEIVSEFLEIEGYEKIAVFGESLGVGPASYHALYSKIDKLVLITPYYELRDLAGWIRLVYPVRTLMRENYKPGKWLREIGNDPPMRMLLIEAENDEIVPSWSSKKLYDAVKGHSDAKQSIFPGTHNTLYSNSEVFAIIKNFLLQD